MGAAMRAERRTFRVAVACPSETATDAIPVHEVMQRWNASRTMSSEAVIVPVRWDVRRARLFDRTWVDYLESNANVDLLIGVFAHTLGDAMREAFEQTIRTGSMVRLYFAAQGTSDPCAPLGRFRLRWERAAFAATYTSTAELGRKFAADLANLLGVKPEDERSAGATAALSADAKMLLEATARDRHGLLVCAEAKSAMAVKTAGRTYLSCEPGGWTAALDELAMLGLLESADGGERLFHITARGYRRADTST